MDDATEVQAMPVLFTTIDRQLMLEPGTAQGWSEVDGFPLAGEGVAFVDQVEQWAVNSKLMEGDVEQWNPFPESPVPKFFEAAAEGSEPSSEPPPAEPVAVEPSPVEPSATKPPAAEPPAAEPPAAEPAADESPAAVEWVTIRVPAVRDSGISLPARRQQVFSLRPTDLKNRRAWGDFLAGCRAENVVLSNGVLADDFSKIFQLIGEQIHGEKRD